MGHGIHMWQNGSPMALKSRICYPYSTHGFAARSIARNSISKRFASHMRSSSHKDGMIQISFYELQIRWIRIEAKVHCCLHDPIMVTK